MTTTADLPLKGRMVRALILAYIRLLSRCYDREFFREHLRNVGWSQTERDVWRSPSGMVLRLPAERSA